MIANELELLGWTEVSNSYYKANTPSMGVLEMAHNPENDRSVIYQRVYDKGSTETFTLQVIFRGYLRKLEDLIYVTHLLIGV